MSIFGIRTLHRLNQVLSSQVSKRTFNWCLTSRSRSQPLTQGHNPWPLEGSRQMATASSSDGIVPQDFNYFLVLDFEATCLRQQRISPQEIIEFPVLKVNGENFETEATFHTYVQPTVHGVSEFCTELTGITQEMVNGQPTLQETLTTFQEWMDSQGLLVPECKSVFVTCGDWDLKTMLPTQCQHFSLKIPTYFNQWINIKKAYAAVTGYFPKGMMPMLHHLDIEHEGKHHSGIDDCKNIAKILSAIASRGYKFTITGNINQYNQSKVKVSRGSRHGRAYNDSNT
ncbi:ERI1 exoribonuclease 3-like isoform X2 [Amphiura filiformis]|uniref:ERI1 exoribonuclease 3-like isoform X1 n=1 Tax=Amphiura filiformis TaxID=82378 RepID=UPI003B20F6E5